MEVLEPAFILFLNPLAILHGITIKKLLPFLGSIIDENERPEQNEQQDKQAQASSDTSLSRRVMTVLPKNV